jgi:ribose transport system substrate-binding protein
MEHMKRALLLLSAVVLAGCSSAAVTTAPVVTNAPVVTTAPDVTAAPKATIDPASITIAYSGFSTSNDFWNTLGKAAKAEADTLGVKFVDVTTETNDAAQQKAAVDTVITQKPSALIIGSVDARVWPDTITKAKAAGIPILAVDTAIDDPYVSTLIATANKDAAGLEGDYICKKTGGKGTIVVIGGTVGHPNGDARKDGISEKTKACGMTVIGDWGDWDSAKDVSIAQNNITANSDVVAVFVAHDDGAAAVAAMIKGKSLTAKIGTYGFDALPIMLKAIKAGDGVASVKQDNLTMGKTAVDLAVKLVNGGTIDKSIAIPGFIIDSTNVDKYLVP